MATYSDVKGFIKTNYHVMEEKGDLLILLFKFNDGRTQRVFINPAGNDATGEWVSIESPIGNVADVDIPGALEFVSSRVCGGLSRVGDFLTVRHMAPIANVDGNEISEPIELIGAIGDMLEEKFGVGDRH